MILLKKYLHKIASGCPSCMGSKFKILEDFYGMDYVLLGKSIHDLKVRPVELKRRFIQEKVNLLLTVVRMMKEVDLSLGLSGDLSLENVKSDIVARSIKARQRSKELILSNRFRSLVDSHISTEIPSNIRKWSLRIALNELLLPDLFGAGLLELTVRDESLLNSYLSNRDSLVRVAERIIEYSVK